MKKILFLFIILFTLSCNDGNFDRPGFDFNTTVYSCTNNTSILLFKLGNENAQEALVLNLNTSDFTEEEGESSVNLTGSKKVSYMLFDGKVSSSSYFCQGIPPTTPKITRTWESQSGASVVITTKPVKNSDNVVTKYTHTIVLKNLVLENNGERLQYDSLNFGTHTINVETK